MGFSGPGAILTEWQSENFVHWLVTVAKPEICDSTPDAIITKTAWGFEESGLHPSDLQEDK